MIKNEIRAPYLINAADTKIKVFRVGSTPHLSRTATPPTDPRVMKGIHTHFTYEVFFITSGTLELITDEYSHVYESGIIIVPPGLHHYSSIASGESYCLLFSLDDSSAPSRQIHSLLDDGIYTLSISDDVKYYVTRFSDKCTDPSPRSQREAELLCSLIFSEVMAQLLPSRALSPRSIPTEHISDIEGYINKNLREKITLSSVAASVHLSSKQISRIIERVYGCSFLELVTDKRLSSAEMLLRNSDMKISDIAAATFPGSENYFYTVFKKKYGMSPFKYRKESKLYK